MARVLLDSSVLIDLLRGRRGAADRLRLLQSSGDVAVTCAVVIEEVTRGLRPGEDDDAIALFEGLDLVPMGMPEGRLAGFWRRSFARRGRTLSQSDCLIAATAVGGTASIATGNPKDFPMKELHVEHWPVGE